MIFDRVYCIVRGSCLTKECTVHSLLIHFGLEILIILCLIDGYIVVSVWLLFILLYRYDATGVIFLRGIFYKL